MDMKFGLWNVKSLYRAGSLMTVSRELARYKLDLVGVQEVRWEDGGTEPAGEYTLRCSLIATSINTLGRLQMGNPIT
jgi:hypothetical protein